MAPKKPLNKAVKNKPPTKTTSRKSTKTESPKKESVIVDSQPKAKVWTEKDDKAVIVQKCIRQFLARRKLLKVKKAKEDFETEMENLEKKAYLEMVKREQLEAERQRQKEEEIRREISEFNKRRKAMLECSFEGNLGGVLTVLKQVEENDDKKGVGRDFIGQNLRKRHILEMINCEDPNKNTPLSEAASGGHAELCQFLIDKGANINTRGQFNRTPVYRAAFAGNLDAVEVLLRNGADPRLYAEDAQTPFDVASTESVKEFISSWDITETEKLLKKIELSGIKLAEENKKRIEAELNNLEMQISKAEKEYGSAEKRLNKAYCELNKRINEHDKAVASGFEKTDITERVIHDAEFEVESARIDYDKTRENLSLLKLKKREKQKEEGMTSGEETKRPGIECNIRELDDVIIRDIGERISGSGKWPIIVDPSNQAATFLRYRDTNYVNALNMGHMEPNRLRIALLGALRYGKPLVLDLMEIVEAFQSCEDRFHEIQPQLMTDIITKSILSPQKYLKLLRPGDDPEYDKNKFSELRTKNFKFILLTSSSLPTNELLDNFQPVWISI